MNRLRLVLGTLAQGFRGKFPVLGLDGRVLRVDDLVSPRVAALVYHAGVRSRSAERERLS